VGEIARTRAAQTVVADHPIGGAKLLCEGGRRLPNAELAAQPFVPVVALVVLPRRVVAAVQATAAGRPKTDRLEAPLMLELLGLSRRDAVARPAKEKTDRLGAVLYPRRTAAGGARQSPRARGAAPSAVGAHRKALDGRVRLQPTERRNRRHLLRQCCSHCSRWVEGEAGAEGEAERLSAMRQVPGPPVTMTRHLCREEPGLLAAAVVAEAAVEAMGEAEGKGGGSERTPQKTALAMRRSKCRMCRRPSLGDGGGAELRPAMKVAMRSRSWRRPRPRLTLQLVRRNRVTRMGTRTSCPRLHRQHGRPRDSCCQVLRRRRARRLLRGAGYRKFSEREVPLHRSILDACQPLFQPALLAKRKRRRPLLLLSISASGADEEGERQRRKRWKSQRRRNARSSRRRRRRAQLGDDDTDVEAWTPRQEAQRPRLEA